MFKDFLANVGMLVSFISICYQLFQSVGVNSKSPIRYRILSGGILGLLGVSLMLFTINLPNNVVIDFRNLAVILSAFNGGWISATVSILIVSTYRIMINGINHSSIAAILTLIIVGSMSCFISHAKIKNPLKWLFSTAISVVFSCIVFLVLIENIALRNEIILYYSTSFSALAFLLYHYIVYLDTLTASFRRYKQESKKDFLTGLNNVRQFDNLYNEIIAKIATRQEMVSLLFIDIDLFKKVNDTYGHKEGDLVLKNLGDLLKRMCRSIDVISRNGGEEFSVILVDCPCSQAVEIAERIRKAIEAAPIELSNGSKIKITVSIGVSCYPDPVKDLEMLIERADEALYEAKRTGRNKVILYK